MVRMRSRVRFPVLAPEATLAQLVEHSHRKRRVPGPNPGGGSRLSSPKDGFAPGGCYNAENGRYGEKRGDREKDCRD